MDPPWGHECWILDKMSSRRLQTRREVLGRKFQEKRRVPAQQRLPRWNCCKVRSRQGSTIRPERFQLLHHAYVYGFNRVAHVVGGLSAQILSATVVNYDNSLLDAYGEVVRTLKEKILNCDQCGKKIKTRANLRRHIRDVHTNNLQGYQCLKCKSAYKRSDDIKVPLSSIYI